MSGHKSAVVTISQEEYRKLYEAERSLYFDKIAQTSSEREIDIENQVKNLADHIEERQSQYMGLIQNLNHDIRLIEQQTSNKLLMDEIDCLKTYVKDQTDFAVDFKEEINRRNNIFSHQLADLETEINQIFLNLSTSISQNSISNQNFGDQAEDYLEAGIVLYSIIQNSYPEHIVAKNELTEFKSNIEMVEKNLSEGADQAALSIAQSAYSFISAYKRTCENRYLDWSICFNEVKTAVLDLKEELFNHHRIQSIDKEGELIGPEIDTNFWSVGMYRELEEKINDMNQYLVENADHISINELKDISRGFIIPIRDLFIKCLMDCRINALNAQLRYEIANSVLVALVEQGFKPIEGDYTNGNYLESYQAAAVSPSGNRINIFVNPGPSNEIENSLHIVSMDNQLLTNEELNSRADEIKKSLIDQGLEVGYFVEQPDSIDLESFENNYEKGVLAKGIHP